MPIATFPAFKSISIGGNTITADESGDTLTFIAGSNITLGYNAENDSVEISATGELTASLPITEDDETNATNYLVFSSSASGNLNPRIDTGLYYNPYTNTLTAGVFNGPSTQWSTARTVTFSGGDVSGSFTIDGSGDVSDVVLTLENGGSGYTLPAATTSTLGGVKIDGTTIQINGSGVISGFNGDYTSLSNKPAIPTAVSQLTNDSGFTTFSGDYNNLTNKPTIPTAVSQLTNDLGFVTQEYSFKIAGDDSVERTISNNETVKFIGASGITVTTDTEGNVTITSSGSASTGDITFAGTTIDSTDSSGIVFQPLVTFNSNVVVENDLLLTGTLTSVGATLNGNLTVNGNIAASGTMSVGNVNITGSIIPTVDNVYDLGTPDLRFRHIYVGPGTIYIGDQSRAITATETSIDLPSGTTIGGEEPLKTTIQNIFNDIINNYLVYSDIAGAPTSLTDLPDNTGRLNQLQSVQITGITYPDGQSYVLVGGGEEITVTGVGFQSLCNVYVNGAPVASTSYVDSTSVTFVTAEVNSAGTYSLNLINPDGTSASWGSGIIFVDSSAPKFTDPSGLLESFSRNSSVSTTLDVAGGASPYTFAITGGALPSGLSLDTSTGVISGTTPSISSNTVYNFIATVTDSLSAATSAAFQIAVIIPVPWTFTTSTFTVKSNKEFMIQLEEDMANTPAFTMNSFTVKSNKTFMIQLEEDMANTPAFTFEAFTVESNSDFMLQLEEDIANAPAFTFETFEVTSISLTNALEEMSYTSPGTYSWTAPTGVTSVSVVTIGGGAGGYSRGGGGGGGLGWKNNISVTPGVSYTVVVGAGGGTSGQDGSISYFNTPETVSGGGGKYASFSYEPTGGGYAGDGGGNGGSGATGQTGLNYYYYGAGGAGGYTGNGGNGGSYLRDTLYRGSPGAGGGGDGGYYTTGVSAATGASILGPNGGGTLYGAGGLGTSEYGVPEQPGTNGAVRIIWGPSTNTIRAFPTTYVESL